MSPSTRPGSSPLVSAVPPAVAAAVARPRRTVAAARCHHGGPAITVGPARTRMVTAGSTAYASGEASPATARVVPGTTEAQASDWAKIVTPATGTHCRPATVTFVTRTGTTHCDGAPAAGRAPATPRGTEATVTVAVVHDPCAAAAINGSPAAASRWTPATVNPQSTPAVNTAPTASRPARPARPSSTGTPALTAAIGHHPPPSPASVPSHTAAAKAASRRSSRTGTSSSSTTWCDFTAVGAGPAERTWPDRSPGFPAAGRAR